MYVVFFLNHDLIVGMEKNWVQASCTGVFGHAHSDGSHVSQKIHHTARHGSHVSQKMPGRVPTCMHPIFSVGTTIFFEDYQSLEFCYEIVSSKRVTFWFCPCLPDWIDL